MDHPITFGEWVKEKRRARRLTQQQLADASGVKRTYINKVENGVVGLPRKGLRDRIIEALGATEKEVDERIGDGWAFAWHSVPDTGEFGKSEEWALRAISSTRHPRDVEVLGTVATLLGQRRLARWPVRVTIELDDSEVDQGKITIEWLRGGVPGWRMGPDIDPFDEDNQEPPEG